MLPLATIWEAGNHISRLGSGGVRRQYASILQKNVSDAMNGAAPYKATHFPDKAEFLQWINEFPEYAARSKSAKKPGEGVSLSDFSIIKEWERECSRHSMSRVLIWSLDSDLSAYDRNLVSAQKRLIGQKRSGF